jgi:hypothetical protein
MQGAAVLGRRGPTAAATPRACAARARSAAPTAAPALPRPSSSSPRQQHRRPPPPAALPRSSSSSSSFSDADAPTTPTSLTYRATVTENRGESGDGAFRTLRLSVADDVPLLTGGVRPAVRSKPSGVRFIDGYKVPGQQVEVRLVVEESGSRGDATTTTNPTTLPPARFVLASSPYEALRESSALAASIIEILVDREAPGDDTAAALGVLAPGDQLDVSGVVGAGWAPLFDALGGSDDDAYHKNSGGGSSALAAALEARRPLLVVGAGAAGAAALRSTLEWTPVQAAASAGRVAAVLAAGRGTAGGDGGDEADGSSSTPSASLSGVPYLIWFDLWRSFGVSLHTPPPLPPGAGALALEAQLFGALFGAGGEPGALRAVLASSGGGNGGGGDVTVLLGGLPRPVALAIVRRLEAEGVPSSQVLFGDPYF